MSRTINQEQKLQKLLQENREEILAITAKHKGNR